MANDQFYVTLPSNSSKEMYGLQPINHYKTKLPVPLNLDIDSYDVGLSEIVYPNSRLNIPHSVQIRFGVHKGIGSEFINVSATIRRGDYSTNRALIDVMQRQFDEVIPKIEQAYYGTSIDKSPFKLNIILDRTTGKTRIKGYVLINIYIPKEIASLLGFGDRDFVITSEELRTEIIENPTNFFPVRENPTCMVWSDDSKCQVISPFNLDTNRGQRMLYVYSPIVSDQFVGDTRVPLLRVLPFERGDFHTKSVRYDHVYYLPLSRSNIHDIEIYITDDTGNLVPFDTGRVIVILHFRKR